MNQLNTSCIKCHFAKEASDDVSCLFYIPDVISSRKKIEIIDNYNYIHNYRCKFGVSKTAAESILEKDENFDLIKYAKEQVSPKYFLFCIVDVGDNLEDICDNINKLEIKPQFISIAFTKEYDVSKAQKICDNKLSKQYNWKLHYFLENKEYHEMFSVVTSTDQRVSQCQFMWIVNSKILSLAIENDSINKINFIINLEQPDIGILNSKLSTDYFVGIFLTIDNIKGIVAHIDSNVGKVIEELYQNSIGYYD